MLPKMLGVFVLTQFLSLSGSNPALSLSNIIPAGEYGVACTFAFVANTYARCPLNGLFGPGKPLEITGLNCEQDCVCVHARAYGVCDPVQRNRCVCHDNATMTETELTEHRQKTCSNVKLTTDFIYNALCNNRVTQLTCKADCICGHGGIGGTCKPEGFKLNNQTYGLCDCLYK